MSEQPIHTTARAIAREQITASILAAGRRHLAEAGPSELSLRGIARELGMVSSAIYRYFPSRDELLTALIVQVYDEIADAVTEADAAVRKRKDFPARWRAFGLALHGWAHEHPHDWALVYGSPVPGYAAPEDTIAPSTRVSKVPLDLLAEIHAAGKWSEASSPRPVRGKTGKAIADLRTLTDNRVPEALLLSGVQSFSTIFGAINLQLFGHFHNAIDDPKNAWFTDLVDHSYPA